MYTLVISFAKLFLLSILVSRNYFFYFVHFAMRLSIISVPAKPLYSTREIAAITGLTQRRIQQAIAEVPERTNPMITITPYAYEGRTPFYTQEDLRRLLVYLGFTAKLVEEQSCGY